MVIRNLKESEGRKVGDIAGLMNYIRTAPEVRPAAACVPCRPSSGLIPTPFPPLDLQDLTSELVRSPPS